VQWLVIFPEPGSHHWRVTAADPQLQLVRRDLRNALALEVLVEFSFVLALAATLGAFNGGRPTTTPPLAQVYFVVGFVVTIAVIVRTRKMLDAATAGDLALLRRLNPAALARIAFLFSAFLPSIYLNAAAADMPWGA
jgi:hypothetical protein